MLYVGINFNTCVALGAVLSFLGINFNTHPFLYVALGGEVFVFCKIIPYICGGLRNTQFVLMAFRLLVCNENDQF